MIFNNLRDNLRLCVMWLKLAGMTLARADLERSISFVAERFPRLCDYLELIKMLCQCVRMTIFACTQSW